MFLGEKGKKIVLKNFVIMGDSQQDCVPFAQNRRRSQLTCLGEVVWNLSQRICSHCSSQAGIFLPNKGYSLLDEGCGDFLFFFVPVPDITKMWAKVPDLLSVPENVFVRGWAVVFQTSALQCKVLMTAVGQNSIMAFSCFSKLNQHSPHTSSHMHKQYISLLSWLPFTEGAGKSCWSHPGKF